MCLDRDKLPVMKRDNHQSRNGHLVRAERAIGKAITELETARNDRDELAGSQAAEKAWLAVAEATNALLRLKGVPERRLPEGHRGAIFLLRKHGGQDMVRVYHESLGILHSNAFYRGLVEWPLIGDHVERARAYVARVRHLVGKE